MQIITGGEALLKMSDRVILIFFLRADTVGPSVENQIKGSFIHSFIHSLFLCIGLCTCIVSNGQLVRQWLLKDLHWAVLYLLEFLRDTVNYIMLNP